MIGTTVAFQVSWRKMAEFWFGLVWFYGISTIVGYLMPNSFLYILTVLFQTIQLSISTLLSSIYPIDKTLSGATTQDQRGPGSNGNEWVLCIPQSSSIAVISLSDCLVSYTGRLFAGSLTPRQKCCWYVL